MIVLAYEVSFAVDEKATTGSEKRAKPEVSGTRGINTDDNFLKGEIKNECSTKESTNSIEVPDWNITAASLPRN